MIAAWRQIADATREQKQSFLRACADTERSQLECLTDILRTNETSEFGRRFKFASIKTVAEYRERVPICTYDDIASDVDAQGRGLRQLCSEPVCFFEETGGSTGGVKRIPFTPSALRAMQRGVEPWLSDLIGHRPGIGKGVGYWSVSPATRTDRRTQAGTPIGSDSDLAFLRAELRQAFAATLATPAEIATHTDAEDWRFATLLSLVSQENLRLVSIWSPSFFSVLLEALPHCFDRLQKLLCDQRPSGESSVIEQLAMFSVADRSATSRRLTRALANAHLDTNRLWPQLDTISCWTHGPAAGPARELATLFPNVFMQGKGLLATEGIVSLPLMAAAMPVLAVQSAFFEFVDEHDRCLLAHELELGATYRVVMTTWSGLYRYDLGDTVRIYGRHRGAPMLEFIGRQGVVSDICGEKLNDAFVSRCLKDIKGFAVVAPAKKGYCLFVDGRMFSDDELPELEGRIEENLAGNPQYGYARKIGQLDRLHAVRVDRPADLYLKRKADLGQKLGGIKPVALCLDAEITAGFSSRALQ